MTRTTCYSMLSCAALLAALGAYGCGGGSTINGTGGTTGGTGGKVDSGAIIIGTGGSLGGVGGRPGAVDGGTNACTANSPCTAGFTCSQTCNVAGVAGTRACMCGNNGTLNCAAGNAGCIRPTVDAGFNMCTAGTPCTAGFTCEQTCNVAGVAGTRACTCGNNGMVNCAAGNAGCVRPMVDAGFNMCMNNFPCTAGFTCEQPCNVGGVAGMRACTCPAGGGMINCPANNASCIRPDAGAPDVGGPVDAPRDVPPPPVDAPAAG